MNTTAVRTAWARGQHGWPARYPLVQFPNWPLIASLVASAVHRVTSGTVADWAWATSRVALAIWAWEELIRGVNLYRRALGLVVLVLVIHGLADRAG